MSLTALSENAISNIDLYFPNMSIYFTPGDSIYSVYSEPEYISYKVLKVYEPKYQVLNETSYQWEFYGQLQRDSDGTISDYLLYSLNDEMAYSLHFVSEDMGLHSTPKNEVEQEESEYYDYGDIEIAKELYRSSMY